MFEQLQLVTNEYTSDDESTLWAVIQMAETNYQCNRGPRPSGALLVTQDGNRTTGAVSPIPNTPSCKDVGCMMENGHCVRNVHAEVDAICRAAMLGRETRNGVMYSINKPCYPCTSVIIKAGIKTIYYAYAVYDEQRTQDILRAYRVKCIHVDVS